MKFYSTFPQWRAEVQGRWESSVDPAHVLPITDCALTAAAMEAAQEAKEAAAGSKGAIPARSIAAVLLEGIESAASLDDLKSMSSRIQGAKSSGGVSESSLDILRSAYRARSSVIYSSITEEVDDAATELQPGAAGSGLHLWRHATVRRRNFGFRLPLGN